MSHSQPEHHFDNSLLSRKYNEWAFVFVAIPLIPRFFLNFIRSKNFIDCAWDHRQIGLWSFLSSYYKTAPFWLGHGHSNKTWLTSLQINSKRFLSWKAINQLNCMVLQKLPIPFLHRPISHFKRPPPQTAFQMPNNFIELSFLFLKTGDAPRLGGL